jgi:GrpB-like predicted nucleotidyltransferase (UPF0157 family)
MALPDPTEVVADQEPSKQAVKAASPPMPARIELRDYDPIWPRLYAREAARIRSALGERVVRLEHAGSTSVPGLAAKPIIDIVLEVPDAAEEATYLPAMQAAGYVLHLREPDWFQHRLLKGPDTDINLHVFSAHCPEPTGCCCFGTGFAATPAIGTCMSAPSGSWPHRPGGRCSSTPTPRPRSSARSWPGPRAPTHRRRPRRRPPAMSLAPMDPL